MTPSDVEETSSTESRQEARGQQVRQATGHSSSHLTDRLVRDLEIHQVELETQNRQLRETQELLEASRDRYADLYDLAPVGYCTLDPVGVIREANWTTERLFGIARPRLIGRGFASLTLDRPAFQDHMRRCYEGAASTTSELELMTERGRLHVQLVSSVAGGDKTGIGYRTAIVDISALKRSEARLHLLSEAGQVLARAVDYEGVMDSVVHLAVPMFADICVLEGLDESGLTRRTAVACSDPVRFERHLTQIRSRTRDDFWTEPQARVRRSGQSELTARLRAPSVDARELEPELTAMMVLPVNVRGRCLGTLTFATAETERSYGPSDLAFGLEIARRAASALESANLRDRAQRVTRARERLLSVVSHDLRAPLGAIIARAGMALDVMQPERDQHATGCDALESIQRLARGMGRLIDDLLDVASVDDGGFSLHIQNHEVSEVVRAAMELMLPMSAERKVNLVCQMESSLGGLACDYDRVVQILGNLIGNALKFTPTGGLVELHAKATEDSVVFGVIDTGPGIPLEHRERIFDRQWRAADTAHLGHGLGLSIAKGIVEAHRGRIWLTNQASGGAAFSFSLPRA